MKKALAFSFLTVLAALVLCLCLYPVPFDPVSSDYPSNPGSTGPYKNNELPTANHLLLDMGKGPEDVTIHPPQKQ